MNEPTMAKTKPLKFKNLSYFGMFEVGFEYMFLCLVLILSATGLRMYLWMNFYLYSWKLLTLPYRFKQKLSAYILWKGNSASNACICIIISSLNQLCGDAWEWITIIIKKLKSVTQRLLVSMKKSHTQVFKNQSNDSRKIISASQCGILASESTLTLSFAW